jgi:hypothetical protein
MNDVKNPYAGYRYPGLCCINLRSPHIEGMNEQKRK